MCIFCKIINKEIPSYIIYEDDCCLAILDISQVTKGHTLILPKQHFETYLDADDQVISHLAKVAKKVAKLIVDKTECQGYNILSNNGETAGQSVGHLHLHIIPRYQVTEGIKIEFNGNDNSNIEATYALLTSSNM